MASSEESTEATALPLLKFIIKSYLLMIDKIYVFPCVPRKRIITILSKNIVLLTHGSERYALQKEENIIQVLLTEKQACETSAASTIPAKNCSLRTYPPLMTQSLLLPPALTSLPSPPWLHMEYKLTCFWKAEVLALPIL